MYVCMYVYIHTYIHIYMYIGAPPTRMVSAALLNHGCDGTWRGIWLVREQASLSILVAAS